MLFALLAVWIVSRRRLIRLFKIPGLIVMPVVFALFATTNLNWLYPGMFFAGMLTIGQFSFWGNYLPRVYPIHLRGTGRELRSEHRWAADRNVVCLAHGYAGHHA